MNLFRELLDTVRITKQKNFNYKQYLSIWRGRKEFLQIAKNFRKLEGSWLGGIKKLISIFMP